MLIWGYEAAGEGDTQEVLDRSRWGRSRHRATLPGQAVLSKGDFLAADAGNYQTGRARTGSYVSFARQASIPFAAAAVFVASGHVALAQGEISGRVTTSDSSRAPVAGAEAVITRLRRSATTDSLGRFRMKDLPAGLHVIVIRAIGFRAESSKVELLPDDVFSLDVRLEPSPATALPERVVTASEERVPAKLFEFNERRKFGVGHFIDRKQLERAEGGMRLTGDVISLVPGVRVRRGGNKAWIATARAVNGSGTCAFCGPAVLNWADRAAGARPACYMDVYLDGTLVFDSRHPDSGLFDVNTLQPEHIAGIELFTSAAQIPAKYNRTAGGCGVLLIWTR